MQTPQVGDKCKADPIEEGEFIFGKITKIEDGLAYADIDFHHSAEFCGDTPTKKHDGVWIFDSF